MFARRFFAGFFLLILGLSIVATPPGRAEAIAVGGNWVNAAKIRITEVSVSEQDRTDGDINGELSDLSIAQINTYISQQVVGEFFDGKLGDDRVWMRANSGCDSKIAFNGSEMELQIINISVPGKGCKQVTPNLDIRIGPQVADLNGASNIWFAWENQNTMVRVDGRDGKFVESDPNQPNKFFREEEAGDSNQDFVTVTGTGATGSYKQDSNTRNIGIQDVDKRQLPAGSTSATPAGGGQRAQDSCASRGGFMSFIMCPIITMIDAGFSFIDDQIEGLLSVDGNILNNPGIKAAWENIRNTAYIITIPIMLVMVIGTALGFEIVSAYTVKKSLPRLALAIVFIGLSYQICMFLITVSNNIGQATLGFLTFPFGTEVGGLRLSNLFGGSKGGVGEIIDLALAIPKMAAAIVGIILLLWLFGSTIFLFVAIGFLVLVFRQMLIVLLVMLAPLAILAWVFPGNDKLWKTWWSLFSKLLIMFPLIMALIAVGRIFAYIIIQP